MKKVFIFNCLLVFFSCQNFGQLKMLGDLPKSLKEVSGNEYIQSTKAIWILEDGGNSSNVYRISSTGKVQHELDIDAKNKDWEDLTSDEFGNLYIGDFGNNYSKRKKLKILKIKKEDLDKEDAKIEEIEFEYEDQKKFPPKKKDRFFDAESFFYFNNHFYIFTKSRVKKKYGKTSLYKVPAVKGKHTAKLIGEYDNGNKVSSWITSADISADGKKVVLLSQKNILIFTNFPGDNFLSGTVQKIPLEHQSQKEGICFKDNNTLLITDERTGGEGGNIYEYILK